MSNNKIDLNSLLSGVSKPKKNLSLGRGISALISDAKPESNKEDFVSTMNQSNSKFNVIEIPIKDCIPSKYQARKDFDEQSLKDLSLSIKEKGVIQPILVRHLPDNKYEIIAGERRYRASQLAYKSTIPAIVMDLDDKAVMEIGLIENLQRKDLNPVEEANAYKALSIDFEYSHEDIAELVGKSRSYISNYLRILSLPPEVLYYLEIGKITPSHAKMLCNVFNPMSVAREIIANNMTVAETERLTMQSVDKNSREKIVDKSKIYSLDSTIQKNIANINDTYKNLKIIAKQKSETSGELKIKYKSIQDINNILQLIAKGGKSE